MTASSGKVYITKLAAAQRQLSAAIRMFFGGEDELAVHTVASAAYGILKDLKAGRGRDEAADTYLTAVFYAIRSFHRGTLPAYLANDPKAMQWIQCMAQRLPITATSRIEEARVAISDQTRTDFWREQNAIANFLKHADRDPESHISQGVNNLQLLMQALSAYHDLTNDLLPEGYVLYLYGCATTDDIVGMPERFRKAAAKLARLDEGSRLKFCFRWLRELRAGRSQR